MWRVAILCGLSACGRLAFDELGDAGAGDAPADDGQIDASPTVGVNAWTGAISTLNAPAGRFWHTGVWTGAELIVFGGTTANASNHVNTGGRYDPATDAWSPTTTTGAPSTRSWHSAVWTGSEMIVWGGRGPNNTGGRYAPADSWISTQTAGAPSPRWSHGAVWTGSRMIVWGGWDTSIALNTGGQYDPTSDTWTSTMTAGAPSPRNNHAAVWTGTKMIVWGGCGGQPSGCSTYLADGGIYDPASNTWSPMTNAGAPVGRTSFRGFWLGGSIRKLLVWGGAIAANTNTNTGGLYDPASDSWTAMSTVGAPSARGSYFATWTGNRLIVWGGSGTAAAATGGIYDPVTDTWVTISSVGAPDGRIEPLGPSAVWTGTRMIVWGGDGANSGENTGGVFAP